MFNFIITICILGKVLGITYFISKYLQTENIDLAVAMESIESTIQKLQDIRTEETFNSIFLQACDIAKEVGRYITNHTKGSRHSKTLIKL